MRWLVAVVAVVLVGAACTGSGNSVARYCDLVKVAEAGSDPLADQAIYNDPVLLKSAMRARVQTYTDLAGRAPSAIRTDASAVRDGVLRVNNALAKHDYHSSTANNDPEVQAVMNDPAFAAAAERLKAYNADTCVNPPTS
jgi:hypothetical protein